MSCAPATSMSSRCLICVVKFESDMSKVNVNVAKIYDKIFHTFCNYFCLPCDDEGEIPFDFQLEVLPFCDNCRDDIVKLCRLDRTMDRIQKQISHLIANITQSIIQSGGTTTTTTKENVIQTSSSSSSSRLSFHEDEECCRKISRYRTSIKKKFNPTVVLSKNYSPIKRKMLTSNNNNKNNEAQSSSSYTVLTSTATYVEIGDSTQTFNPNQLNAQKNQKVHKGISASLFCSDEGCDAKDQMTHPQNLELENPESQNLSFTNNNVDDDFFDGNDDEVQQQTSYSSDVNNVDGDEMAEEGNVEDQMEIEKSSHSFTTTQDNTMKESIPAKNSSHTLMERIRNENKRQLTEHEFLYYGTWPVKRIGSSSVCQTCGISINSNRNLFLHMRQRHGDPRKSECPTCHEEMENEPDFIEHILIHPDLSLADQVIPCGQAKFLFGGRWFFDENENRFLCTSCGMETRSRDGILRHLKYHKNNQVTRIRKKFECNVCEMTFPNENWQNYHIKRFHVQKKRINCRTGRLGATKMNQSSIPTAHKPIAVPLSLVCPVCAKKYNNLNSYQKLHKFVAHVTDTHPEVNIRHEIVDCGQGNLLCDGTWLFLKKEDGFQCKFCGDLIMEGRDNIREHVDNNHPGVICKTCGMTFRNTHGLSMHKFHAHSFMDVAKTAGKGGGKAATAAAATRTTTAVTSEVNLPPLKRRPQVVNQQATQNKLKGKENNNNGNNMSRCNGRLTCTHCPKTFTLKSNLTRHERIHKSINSYKCQFCESTFNRPDSLLSHQNQHGVKSFSRRCSLCKKLYTSKSGYYSHLSKICRKSKSVIQMKPGM